VFVAEDGERVTLVRFADRASHEAWARHPDHRAAQRAGIEEYYEEYSIAVGAVDRASAWVRPD
jgi:heme-degrading monooxygenase HmoA